MGDVEQLAINGKLPALESGRMPVVLPAGGGGLTDTELRATAVPVSVASVPSHAVTGPLTDTQLRATAVPVSLASVPTHGVTGTFWQATQPVSGTFWQGTQPVSGPLTDAQLRATAVPVSGTFGSATPFTVVSAKTAAPTASAVQADTGALAAGEYELLISLAVADTVAVGKGLVIEHRNAANGANINVLGGATPNGGAVQIEIPRLTLALNERIRVIAGTAAGAASSMYVSSIARRLL